MITLYKTKSFSENPEEGNLAGVVTNAEYLSDIEMQNIAAKVGASETSFILPSVHADIRIRWFTPNTEVGMCVHATIAALGVMQSQNVFSSDTVRVETKNGELISRFRDNHIFIRVSGYHSIFYEVEISKILAFLPLKSSQLIGDPHIIKIFDDCELVIEVKCLDDLRNLKPIQKSYADICSRLEVTGISIFTRDTLDSKNQIHTREFAPLYGYLEDPLCGMAAGAICAYLQEMKTTRIEQGNFCDTSGVIIVEPESSDTFWIGGNYCIV